MSISASEEFSSFFRTSLDVTLDETVPAHVGPDKRGIDVYDLGGDDLRFKAGLNRSLEISCGSARHPSADVCASNSSDQAMSREGRIQ